MVFSVNLKHTEWHDITPSDVVSVRGTPNNTAPPVFDWDTPGLNILFDDGIAPDATAGDVEEELPGWNIQIGPREAAHLGKFLKEWSPDK